MSKTIIISDLDMKGSGYMKIALSAAQELSKRGRDVTILGIGYNPEEVNNMPFQIIPVDKGQMGVHLSAMLNNFQFMAQNGAYPPLDAVIIAMDIPYQLQLAPYVKNAPVVGIYPVEAGPIPMTWANGLGSLHANLCISQFGTSELINAGVPATYFPVAMEAEHWRAPSEEERASIRKAFQYDDDTFVVLTVADNQERKNLSGAMQVFANFRDRLKMEGKKAHWVVVTRENNPFGWKMQDMMLDMGVTGAVTIHERGISHQELWSLYAMSDAFLLMSKAEGLCMPALEAMAVGLPVLLPDCTALIEHLWELPKKPIEKAPNKILDLMRRELAVYELAKADRGYALPIIYKHREVFGNGWRYYVDIDAASDILYHVYEQTGSPEQNDMIDRAAAYAVSKRWSDTGDVLTEALEKATAAFARQNMQAAAQQAPNPNPMAGPSVMPTAIPPMTTTPNQEGPNNG